MPSTKPNMIDALRAKHDPHYQLAGKVERLEKDIPIQLAQLHKTLSKSFGMQRKTLVRVLGLEKRLAELETAEAAVEEVVEKIEEEVKDEPPKEPKVVDDISEEPEGEDEIPPGLDDVLDDVRSEPEPKKKKPEAKKKKKKKRPPIKAKKRKISAKDLAKGTPFDAGYKSRVMGEDEEGEYLSPEERKRRFKFGDTQEKDGVSKTIEDVSQTQQPASPLDGVIGVVNSIAGSVDSIRQTLIGQQKVSQEQVSEQREERQKKKRGMKEKALEAGGKIMGGAKKMGEKILAPVKGMWTKLMDFLIGVLLGNAVMKLFDWFTDSANKDKVSSLFKFLKDWWPLILAGIMKFVPILLGPGGMIIGTIALLAWGIPKIVNIVKSIFGFGTKVDKELKNVDTDATKTGEELGKNIENDAKKLGGDAPETEDPAKSSTPAELGDADKAQKDVKNVEQPQGMKQGGPVESKEGGQIRGEKGDDKVPAMLTDGEFVLSKGAVQAYGVDTLAAMNAAAGGTNQPTEKDGKPAYSGGGPVGQPDKSHFGTTGYRMGQMRPDMFVYSHEKFISSYKEKDGKVIEDQEDYNEIMGSIGMPDLIEHQTQLVESIRKVEGYENINFMDVVQYPDGQGRLVSMPPEKLYPIFNASDAWKATDAKRDEAIRIDQEAGTQFLNPDETAKAVGLNDGGLVNNTNNNTNTSSLVQNFAGGGLVTNNTNTNTNTSSLLQNFAGGGLVQSISNIMTMSDGGNVPGSGNKDTVPAMLTPGEFVMNKESTAKIGVQNLMKMNANMSKGALGGVLGGALGGVLGGAKKLAMKNPLAQMAKGIGNLFGGAKDKLGEIMGDKGGEIMGDKGGDEDKVIGIASADIPKGSPLMKSTKPPAGDAIKPPTKSSDKGGVSLISGGGSGGGGQNMAGVGGGKMLPLIDPAKKISANKIAVLGITV